MRRILTALACLLAIGTLSVPGAEAERAAHRAAEGLLGKWFYTKINIWYENPRSIPTTNFHRGGILPVGTRVKILEMDDTKISFLDEGTGVLTLTYVRKHTRLGGIRDVFERYFASEDTKKEKGPFQKLTEMERMNIDRGSVVAGMTKDAVVMAYGYPPSHRTPSLDQNRWTYWIDRRNVVVVEFDERGKVQGSNVDNRAGEDDMVSAASPVSKKFFTRTNIWYEERDHIYSINYHKGTMIPAGTPVDVVDFGRDAIRFVVAKESETNVIEHLVKYSNVDLEEVFDRLFVEENPMAPGGDFESFNKTEQDNIRKGIVDRGMSKRAVLMAYGYPPGHRTPDLDHHIWTYWQSRGKRVVVYFRADQVINVDYP